MLVIFNNLLEFFERNLANISEVIKVRLLLPFFFLILEISHKTIFFFVFASLLILIFLKGFLSLFLIMHYVV